MPSKSSTKNNPLQQTHFDSAKVMVPATQSTLNDLLISSVPPISMTSIDDLSEERINEPVMDNSTIIEQTMMDEADHLFGAIPKYSHKLKAINRGVYEKARLTRVYQLDLNDPVIRNIPRSGYLPYTFIDDQIYLCYGRDKASGDVCVLAGMRKWNENIIQCAVREGNEESRLVFGDITEEQVQGFLCLYSSHMMLILVPVDGPKTMAKTMIRKDIREITVRNFESQRFLNKRQSRNPSYNELSAIIWFDRDQTTNLFSDRPKFQMFAKERRFIYSCDYFSQNFDQLIEILRNIFISGQSSDPVESTSSEPVEPVLSEIAPSSAEPVEPVEPPSPANSLIPAPIPLVSSSPAVSLEWSRYPVIPTQFRWPYVPVSMYYPPSLSHPTMFLPYSYRWPESNHIHVSYDPSVRPNYETPRVNPSLFEDQSPETIQSTQIPPIDVLSQPAPEYKGREYKVHDPGRRPRSSQITRARPWIDRTRVTKQIKPPYNFHMGWDANHAIWNYQEWAQQQSTVTVKSH